MTCHEDTAGAVEAYLYSCLISALEVGQWAHPSRFTWGRQPRYLLCMRLCGPQCRSERSRRTENLLPSPGFEYRTIEPVVSGSTNNATFHPPTPSPPHNNMNYTKFSKNKRTICIKFCPFGLLWRCSYLTYTNGFCVTRLVGSRKHEACNLIKLYRFYLI